MKFTISTQDNRTFVSLLWYIENKLKNDNTHHFFTGECLNYDMEDNKLIDFAAFDNEFTFFYEDEEIKISRQRISKPIFINTRCEAGFMEEIVMYFPKREKDDEFYIKLMKKLFLESKEAFDENRRFKHTKDKLMLWSYQEGYWEDMKKINKRKFDTVILDLHVKDEVKKMIDKYNDKEFKEKLASFGIAHKLNIILEGLPGTGKSSTMFAIATLLRKDIATVDFNSKELSDHNFMQAINKLPKDTIMVMEDLDALYLERDKSNDNRVSFSCILNFLDGLYSKEDLVTVITTNHIKRLDKAIIRPMRIDKIITFTYASKYQYEEIFNKFFPDNVDLLKEIYKKIKSKKYTTSMLQRWFISYLDEPKLLLDNIKYFEELIDVSTDKDYSERMFT